MADIRSCGHKIYERCSMEELYRESEMRRRRYFKFDHLSDYMYFSDDGNMSCDDYVTKRLLELGIDKEDQYNVTMWLYVEFHIIEKLRECKNNIHHGRDNLNWLNKKRSFKKLFTKWLFYKRERYELHVVSLIDDIREQERILKLLTTEKHKLKNIQRYLRAKTDFKAISMVEMFS